MPEPRSNSTVISVGESLQVQTNCRSELQPNLIIDDLIASKFMAKNLSSIRKNESPLMLVASKFCANFYL